MYSIDDLIKRYPALQSCKEDILKVYDILENCYKNGGKLLIAGNGGSCSDSEHIVGELMKGFKLKRELSNELKEKLKEIDSTKGEFLSNSLQQGLPAIALDSHQALNTAFINDVEGGGLLTFAQELLGLAKPGDVFLGISTSGNSKNVEYACITAKALGLKVVGLSGKDGGVLKKLSDACVVVPSNETFMIQELHLPIYHYLCLKLEDKFFN